MSWNFVLLMVCHELESCAVAGCSEPLRCGVVVGLEENSR